MQDDLTAAEVMIDLANAVLEDRNEVTNFADVHLKIDWDVTAARVVTALKLRRAPKALQLRAIVEAWSVQRIVRELY